ncbi:MAG: malonyl-CoA decarboxylase [Paracoccaceae bacterium]|jgi:malonyl-CoA decarboxylase
MTLLADLLSTVFERRSYFGSSGKWDDRSVAMLADELVGGNGEVSGRALARQILDRFTAFEDAQKVEFFRHLALNMDIDAEVVRTTLEAYRAHPDKAGYQAFMMAAEPRRQEMIRRLNQVSGATHLLVSMRRDLLRLTKSNPELAPIDVDFKHLFASWFNRGFLVLRPISWESPAHILEKIIAYEAVHAIDSWGDLKRRLQPSDRRCFGFFHPSMPDEPLIFVEVALCKGVPGAIHTVLSDGREPLEAKQADTAVFYSISNCQAGLAGISFGNSLIKQVVTDLSLQLPGLKTFVTLSPIPKLMAWLTRDGRDVPALDDAMLKKRAANYLLTAKRSDGLPFDPVARFHLGNGAIIHAVHSGADLSANGLAQSGGAMVNYLYDLRRVAQNHERFVGEQDVIASSEVRTLSQSALKSEQ